MSKCYLCIAELTPENEVEEHIILNSICNRHIKKQYPNTAR